jgi:hypothetical protein
VNKSETSRAIDGDPKSRWSTRRPTAVGDGFGLDLGQIRTISKIRIETNASENDYSRNMQIRLSKDRRDWSDIVYSGKGDTDFCIKFDPRATRYILIRNLSDRRGFWSIHEIDVSDRSAD